MAGSWNRVELGGNVGKDPEIRTFPSGGKMVSFSLATTERWKDRETGEQKEKTSWHNIIARNDKSVEFIEKYIRKGMSLRVEGKIVYREWEKDGIKHYRTEIEIAQVGGIIFLDRRETSESYVAPTSRAAPQQNGYARSDESDEIPF